MLDYLSTMTEQRLPQDSYIPPEQINVEMQQINTLLAQLQYYETDLKNDEVERAVAITLETFAKHKNWFLQHGVIATYHGSLLYHDPKNLDADVVCFTRKWTTREELDYILAIGREFDRLTTWPRMPFDEDVSFFSIDKIRQEISFAHRGAIPKDSEEDGSYNAAMLLSSQLLFPEQEGLYREMQEEILTFAQEDPLLRHGIIAALQQCIDIRQERRSSLETE